ncbi:glycosyltransferase family 4 protein [Halosimplex salinum]|uniref:glycosyltransferase family 4 protein n=1 Tax=Halosimplex salinum TaxID=1710538 RepID=UPI000F48B229|nr:glycosyltransferase family 4 protein [Halosimplex salinum]
MDTEATGSVLFVSPGPSIVDPESGEGARLHHLSRSLADRWDVYTLVPEENADRCPDWAVRQYTYEQWSLPFLTDLNPSFVGAVRRVFSNEPIDVVHLSSGVCTTRLVNRFDGDASVVYAAQNVEADHAKDFVDPTLPAYKRAAAPKLIPLIERTTVACADAVTTVSAKDRDRFVDRYDVPRDHVRAIPTGTEKVDRSALEETPTIRDRFGLDDRPVAVFHGYYDHPPNREAANLIGERIAPAVLERDLDVQFLLVGRNAPAISAPNVHVAGFVDDLYSTLDAADVAIVPILHGGGTKTKIYDYLSLQLPMVTTRKGIEGIDIEDERHALVSDTVDEEFVDAIHRLIRDGELATELRGNLGALVETLDWTRSADRLDEFYRTL